jgi:hypothetical protein
MLLSAEVGGLRRDRRSAVPVPVPGRCSWASRAAWAVRVGAAAGHSPGARPQSRSRRGDLVRRFVTGDGHRSAAACDRSRQPGCSPWRSRGPRPVRSLDRGFKFRRNRRVVPRGVWGPGSGGGPSLVVHSDGRTPVLVLGVQGLRDDLAPRSLTVGGDCSLLRVVGPGDPGFSPWRSRGSRPPVVRLPGALGLPGVPSRYPCSQEHVHAN